MDIYTATELSYKNGYDRGMEAAIKQGYAHCPVTPTESESMIPFADILAMLYIIHEENKTIMSLLGVDSELVEGYEDIVRNEIKAYTQSGAVNTK